MQDSLPPLKILWMIPKWTLPATDGARVATDSLIRNTIAAGALVDVMCISQLSEKTDTDMMKKAWGVKSVTVYPRSLPEGGTAKMLYYFGKLVFNPFTPLTFSSFSEKSLKQKVLRHIANNRYDFILLDGLHLGALLIENDKFHEISKNSKIILRAHNIEVDLWKKAYQEKSSPILKFILYLQSRLVEKFEKLIFDSCQGVAAISQEDLVEIKNISSTKSELVPLGLNFDHPLDICQEKDMRFLFIGRLDWPPNRDGLEWILKEVWPSVIENRPEAELKIVGSGKKEWLKNYQHLKGVKIVGFVDSIRDAYQDCHFTIVPITYGSGTRIKVLESFALGRRLISTKMGVQGADLKQVDYVNAETKEEWIDTLSTISFNESQQNQLDASREVLASKFGEKHVGASFYQWLKTLA
jgi:glycosyltransferase involved in cell wall biosynthesis